jgi:hypothetical protein
MIKVKPEISKELDDYLEMAVKDAIQHRDELLPRVEKWRRSLSGVRALQTFTRQGASNISVPLLIWARVAVRARLAESILDNPSLVYITPVPSSRESSNKSNTTIANNLAKFISAEIWNERGLAGRTATEKFIAEMVDLGASCIKVVPNQDVVKKLSPRFDLGTEEPRIVPSRGRIKWDHVSLLNLLWKDGYGTDTQAMPFIGHQFVRRWSQIKSFANIGHYDKQAVAEVEKSYKTTKSNEPISLREHDIAEIYLDWDIDGDDIEESIVVDWHISGRKRLRTNWNPYPEGTRPILVGQFDLPPDIDDLRGQGLSDKLEGPQDEVDAVHNITIESGKRGAAHIIVLKANSRAEEEFGGEQDVLPGDVIVTDNPAEDVVVVPLGDSNAAIAGLQMESYTKGYAQEILGLGPAQTGQLQTAQRVPSSLGQSVMSEGRMPIRAALTSVSRVLTEATYLTFDLYKQYVPIAALEAALGPEDAATLISSVFSLDDASIRSSFLIRVNAADAALEASERQRELSMLGQILFPYYDRLQQLIVTISSPELPPLAKKPLLLLVERMERGIEAMLNTVESIPGPEELMVRIGELTGMLNESGDLLSPTSTGPNAPEDSLVGDLGAGVV